MVLQEVNVFELSEQEKLQIQIDGCLSFLIMLRKAAESNNTMHLYPMFNDMTVCDMMEAYQKIQAIRGY